MGLLQLILQAYRLLPVCLFIFCIMAVSPAQANQSGYHEELIEKSLSLGISSERAWRVLLHYAEAAGGESRIDDPTFFLAPDGKFDPEAELLATVAGLFAPEALGDKHPRCRFPARDFWLTTRLGIDPSRLARPICAEQTNFLTRLNPRSASIMFPASYINSPASMFGHTFIRIDGAYESELLSYAINYAAQTDETNGMVYAWKGVFGNYKGYYSILPQYAKIREYSSLEHRDIWEYRLNLTPEEVHQLSLHVWELRDIYSDYYFFDENCSYNLLFLLEAARPSVHLTDRTALIVVPLDTISLVRSAELLSATGYRPSQGRKIRAITRMMSSEDIRIAQQIANREAVAEPSGIGVTTDRSTRILDLAIELLQFSYAKQKIDQENYRNRLLPLLTARSHLGTRQDDPYPIPTPVEPEQGHATSRVSIGGGIRESSAFTTIGVRPAYHSLNDPGDGYVEGAQIQFMDTALRYYPDDDKVKLERLSIVDIVSLSEFEPIFKRVSWKVSAGMEQVQDKSGDENLVFRVNSGGGLAVDSGTMGLFYGLIEMDGNLGEGLRDWYALGAGFSAGMITNIGTKFQLHLTASAIWYPLGEERSTFNGKTVVSYYLDRNNSLDAEVRYDETSHHAREEASMIWNHYF